MRTPKWKWPFIVGASLLACSCSDQSDSITARDPQATARGVMPSLTTTPRPFKGSVAGETHWKWSNVCLPAQPVRTYTATTGEIAHLGRVTVESEHCSSADGQWALNGSMAFTAANGDKLLGSYVMHVVRPAPSEVGCEGLLMCFAEQGSVTVTGGTGRFEHAAGTISVTVGVYPTEMPPTIESRWPVQLWYDGTIQY